MFRKIGLFLVLGVLSSSVFGMECTGKVVEKLPQEMLMVIFVYDSDLCKDGDVLGLEGVKEDQSFIDVSKLLGKEGVVSKEWREAAKRLVSISEGPELVVSVKDRDVRLREDAVIRGLELLLHSHVLFRIIGVDDQGRKTVLHSCALKPGDLDKGDLSEFMHTFSDGFWKESRQELKTITLSAAKTAAKTLWAFVAPIGFYCLREYLMGLANKLYEKLDCGPNTIRHPNVLLDRVLYRHPRILCNGLSSLKNFVTMGQAWGCFSGIFFLSAVEFRCLTGPRVDPHFNEHVPRNFWWKEGMRSVKAGLTELTLPPFRAPTKLLGMIFLSRWLPVSGAWDTWLTRMAKFYYSAEKLRQLVNFGFVVRDGYCDGCNTFIAQRAAGQVPSPTRFKEIVSDYWTYYGNQRVRKNNSI